MSETTFRSSTMEQNHDTMCYCQCDCCCCLLLSLLSSFFVGFYVRFFFFFFLLRLLLLHMLCSLLSEQNVYYVAYNITRYFFNHFFPLRFVSRYFTLPVNKQVILMHLSWLIPANAIMEHFLFKYMELYLAFERMMLLHTPSRCIICIFFALQHRKYFQFHSHYCEETTFIDASKR